MSYLCGMDKEKGLLNDITPLTEDDIREMMKRRTKGLRTGLTFKGKNGTTEELTLNTGITIVCASTGHGKTSFLNNIALRMALNDGNDGAVVYFSYEISKGELIGDLISTYVGESCKVKDGVSTQDSVIAHYKGDNSSLSDPDEWERKEKELVDKAFASGKLLVVDKDYSAEELVEALTFYKSHIRTKLVLVDYAQMLYSSQRDRLRTEEIKHIVGRIAQFANVNSLPVLMAAQFNQQALSPVSMTERNIGEGGDFSRIANTIVGIYNLERLHPTLNAMEDKQLVSLMASLGEPCQKNDGTIIPVRGRMLFKLIKRRGGQADLYTVVEWDGRTKRFLVPAWI